MPIKLYEDGTIIDYARSPGSKPPGGRVNGQKRKTFEISGKHKRFIRSSAIRQALVSKYRLLFATLTFPSDIEQKAANRCFSNFVDNLKTNFNLHSYVAVKENHPGTSKNSTGVAKGRPHFHIILDIPYTDYKILNRAWCSAFNDYMSGSNNAFTTGKRPIVSRVEDVARYITKYITKAEDAQSGVKPTTRQYFISKNVHCQPATIQSGMKIYLESAHGAAVYKSDHYTWSRLYDFSELPERTLAEMQKILEVSQRYKQRKPSKLPDPPPEYQLQIDTFDRQIIDFSYNS